MCEELFAGKTHAMKIMKFQKAKWEGVTAVHGDR